MSRFLMNYFCVFVSIILYRLFYCHAGTGPGQIWCHQYLKPFRCVCLYFIVFVPFSLDIIFYLCIGVFVCFCICAFVFLYLCICIFVIVVLWWLADGRVSAISKTLRLHRRLHVLFKQE